VAAAIAFVSLALLSVGVIVVLCLFSFKIGETKYFDDSMNSTKDTVGEFEDPKTVAQYKNLLVQNILSVFVYLVVSIPLEGQYNKIITTLTNYEGHMSQGNYMPRLVSRSALFQIVNYMGWFCFLGFWGEAWLSMRAQLITFFLIKPSGVAGSLVELVKAFCRNRTPQIPEENNSPSEYRKQLILVAYKKDTLQLGDEYLQVALMFAAATFFSPVCPEGWIFVFAHTILEYLGDKSKLRHMRTAMPRHSRVFVCKAWVQVFSVIGWLGICISTWLVYVVLKKLGTENMGECLHLKNSTPPRVSCPARSTIPSWDDYVTWDPSHRADDAISEILSAVFRRGSQTVFILVIVQHILFGLKAYVDYQIPTESHECKLHKELVDDVLAKYDTMRTENRLAKKVFEKFRAGASGSTKLA
jgi:hypothetical protein